MLQLKTPPTGLAVSLLDAKTHCRVESNDEDLLLEMYIRSATEMAEQRIGRSLMPQTWLKTLDSFPEAAVLLPNIPVSAIESVKYLDATGVEVVLAPEAYELFAADDFAAAELLPARGTSWPAAMCRKGSVRIEYTAGYPSAAAIPSTVRSWILLQVGAMYEHRELEGAVQTYPLGYADRLLDRSKVWSL